MNEAKPTPGPWRDGKYCGAIVSDSPIEGYTQDEGSVKFYGGYVVCESVAACNMSAIIAVPIMLAALRAIEFETDAEKARTIAHDAIAKAELLRRLNEADALESLDSSEDSQPEAKCASLSEEIDRIKAEDGRAK